MQERSPDTESIDDADNLYLLKTRLCQYILPRRDFAEDSLPTDGESVTVDPNSLSLSSLKPREMRGFR